MKNAWDVPTIIKGSDNYDERTTVHPLPPLPEITLAVQPWYLEEAHVQEYQAAQSNVGEYHHEHPHEESSQFQQEYEEHHHQEEHNNADYQESFQDDQQTHHQHESRSHEANNEPAPPPAHEREYAMLNWNPSWEEPPTNKNDIDIPDLQIYSNAWDYHQPNDHVWVAPAVEELPPPPSMIDYHHQYIHHHQEVQDEHPQEAAPYVAVFPWEEEKEYRPAPSRIWQDELERERRAREEAEWLRAEEEARVRAEEEARWQEEEEKKRVEREQAAAQWNQEEVTGQSFGVNNQQEVIQQAMDAEAGIIEQTVSESHDHHQQSSTLDQPFVSVWDQMPSIKRYLALLGANEAFKKSEYQTYQSQEEEQEEVTYSQQEQELTTDDDDDEEEEEDYESEEEEEEEEEDVQEDIPAETVAPPTQANSWWGEPFAIDSMPTTPRLNKFGWRSPLMPTTPRLEDDDWDDRDLIPLPLKRTSRLYQPEALYQQEFTSPPKTTAADIPKSNASVSESEGSVKQQKKKRRVKKPRKLFADEDDMLKRTPFASAVTTPTSEKSFLLPNVDDEAQTDIIDAAESESFGEYKIQWASDLLKGSQAGIITPMARTPSREKDATSYFEGAASPGTPKKNRYNALASRTVWDPLRALKSLKANGEKLLITTKLGDSEKGIAHDDVEDSDEEYAPAAYYDNDDEEDLGVLGLTFPKSRSSFGYALSKDDSPQYESMTASPATPTAKGMTMNLTDKIIQEAADRRANTDFALHEAATSLVKSTEEDDDRYAMSPVIEEFQGKNVSATELEMSSGDLFKRRSSVETPIKDVPTTPSAAETKDEQPLDKQTAVDTTESAAESHPVQYDIVQAATEKLRQIAGVDWEAAAKEDSSRDNDVSNWVFAQQYEDVPSAQQTVAEEQPKDTVTNEPEVPSVPHDSTPEALAIAEEPVDEIKKDQQKDTTVQVEPAQVEPAEVTPHTTSEDDVLTKEDQPTISSDLPKPSDESEVPKESTEPRIEADGAKSEARKVPGHLSFKGHNVENVHTDVHRYDDLKTPTQATFVSGIHPDVPVSTTETTSEYSSEGEQSLPEDIKKNLVDTVEHLVRKVEAGEPSTSDFLQGTDKTQLMERETSMSNRDAQALSEEEITSYIHRPTVHPPQAPATSTDPITSMPAHTEYTERDEDDDDLSDTQYLSATEGDHHSESGTSVDWFSVRSSNASEHSDYEDDQRVPATHQEFLRQFGGFPQLNNEMSSLDSWTHSEENNAESHSVNQPTESITPDDASDRTP
ncbi:hypothetical protein K450DRAFT_238995 [Umbelopsis ramanniana AG]|uniref:Uncharacterized protein n=1 Tax=Umbelopsis ramanniana AG TaxID=1314678 RepID=A0AAD5EBT4_UMBRA|nr:uncharacterized protein K450DRAFT_238995 [Umbelopsis ramanniana AG]KAI8580025.1 hypothetical protein K450DRAFT_238995 [Umbelopsis ramanniana AG]